MRLLPVAAVTLVALAGAGGWAVVNERAQKHRPEPVSSVTTTVGDVVQTDVAERQQVSGTLGRTGTYNVIAPAPGTLTRLPATGKVVRRGQAAYEIDGRPVILMYGKRPTWRAFKNGMTDGADVLQLEANLTALGYGGGLTVDEHFSGATHSAVRHWQTAVHLPATGSVPPGQIVFLPDAVRIGGHDQKVGSPVQPGVLVEHGTSDERAVSVQLQPSLLPNVRVGDPVVVTLPDGGTRTGRISEIGAAATTSSSGSRSSESSSGGSTPTAPVTIKVKGKIKGFLDQASVQVAITVELHRNVLAVPITALRALADGSYEVIVVDGTRTRHVPVQTGLFDPTTGTAEVSGDGLAEGQKVEVPRAEA